MPDEDIDFSDIPPTAPAFWRRASERRTLSSVANGSKLLLARRRLTLVEDTERKEIDVEIGPITNHAQDASCHVRIAATDNEFNWEIYGVDAVQALQLALRFAGSELDRLGGDRWKHLDENGHGFDRISDMKTAS